MVDSPSGRQEFMAKHDNHSISISALNCSGNPLYLGVTGERHWQVTRKTAVLAGLVRTDLAISHGFTRAGAHSKRVR